MLIRPRLTDFHGISVAQADLDFAIPFFDEDIPLYLDPFMLWRSPSQQDQMLHTGLVNAFNHLGHLTKNGGEKKAIQTLITASECDEVGLGTSETRRGKRIGKEKAEEILSLFRRIPEYGSTGFRHFEEIQLFIDGISKDRISDIACNFLKSFLIDFTIDQCATHGIPCKHVDIRDIYDYRTNSFITEKSITLPVNPNDDSPLIFVPKRWLRFVPWISYDDYFHHHCPLDEVAHTPEERTRVKVLNFNRNHYGAVDAYVKAKELTAQDCANDPLFSQIPIPSAKRTLTQIKKLPTGKTDGADRNYEQLIGKLLPSLLYPQLDFAKEQARTDDGVSIRDLIFYNTRTTPFLQELMSDYGSRQITLEIKNVQQIGREHIDQLNRYLTNDLGNFGILVTRNRLKKAEMTRTINLWAGQRKSIVVLTDSDIEQMVEVFESKQRSPLEVIVKKYVEFRRECP